MKNNIKTKSILLISLFLAISHKTMAQDLNPDKSIRITKQDVTNRDTEINLITLAATGLCVGMTKRYINKTYENTPNSQKYNSIVNNYILGPLTALISLQYDTTNLSVFIASTIVGLEPDLLCGASKGLIFGKIIGSAANELFNDSGEDKFDSGLMKGGAILGTMLEMKDDPISSKILTGATSCWLTYCLSRKLKESQS